MTMMNAGSSTNNNDERERQIEKLNEDIKALKEVIDKQESRLGKLQSKGFQLANYYFVFQGVILTTLCNRNTILKCSDGWFLATLSALAATVNLFALVSIGLKYNTIFTQQDKYQQKRHKLMKEKESLVSRREYVRQEDDAAVDKREIIKRRVYFGICMTFFLSFAIIVFVGSLTFLC
jgi:hypothetical protein